MHEDRPMSHNVYGSIVCNKHYWGNEQNLSMDNAAFPNLIMQLRSCKRISLFLGCIPEVIFMDKGSPCLPGIVELIKAKKCMWVERDRDRENRHGQMLVIGESG